MYYHTLNETILLYLISRGLLAIGLNDRRTNLVQNAVLTLSPNLYRLSPTALFWCCSPPQMRWNWDALITSWRLTDGSSDQNATLFPSDPDAWFRPRALEYNIIHDTMIILIHLVKHIQKILKKDIYQVFIKLVYQMIIYKYTSYTFIQLDQIVGYVLHQSKKM